MQKAITLIATLFIMISMVSAQNVNTMEKTMSLGKQQAVYVEIEGADEDKTQDLWKDYVDDYGKVKRNKKAREYYTVGARVPLISSSNNVDLYAKFDESKSMTTVYLWVDNAGTITNDNEGLKTFLQDYYVLVRKEVINEEIEDQEDVLKKLTKKMGKLVKKNTGYHKDITKAEEKIRKSEEKIEQNLNDQDQMTSEIDKEKETLDMIIEKLNNVGKGND